jgi:hypothetical protein
MTRSSSDVKSDKAVLHCKNVRIHFGFAIAFGLPLKRAYHLLHISDFHPLISIKFVQQFVQLPVLPLQAQPTMWKRLEPPGSTNQPITMFSARVPVQLLLNSTPYNQLANDEEYRHFAIHFTQSHCDSSNCSLSALMNLQFTIY